MLFRQLFDPESSTYTYLLADEATGEAVIIDPVLEQAERDLALIEALGLKLVYVIDTHVHADHITASDLLRKRTGCTTILSEKAGVECADRPVKDGDRIRFGSQELEVLETPGHTSGCLSFVTGDRAMAFTGDALLIGGTGRTDFQQGDAHQLYRSITEKLFRLPESTVVYPGHDYKGRTASTIGDEKRLNPRLGQGKTEEDFVEIMANLGLPYPKKIDAALPANLRCGSAQAPSMEHVDS
ncbi:MBL fold metallo-hydrolase [Vulgatibacter incomptus]|uniref:Hydroxyacylglutathione hydrolase n=1 Tax=Vulgatibacter incomptus TaxID=1391653 RepID=A0A0K1PG06_9BACT|nr:MBL fold metallo-hydrolase [Vulgatibacter incomptus]AKU92450.1 Hydroxyacylglutathione hydrolase [Vulgatibacter incomptus]